jgi:hypothetical protein
MGKEKDINIILSSLNVRHALFMINVLRIGQEEY